MNDYDIVMYFYNPNIHPYGEYCKRLENEEKVAEHFGVKVVEGEYSVHHWLDLISGFEEEPEGGRRCKICFMQRLKKTAEYAKEKGFDCFTTTMSISPHKDSELINNIGEQFAKTFGVEWVHSDFKKKEGFRKSVSMSKKLGLYRQERCGCFYSVK